MSSNLLRVRRISSGTSTRQTYFANFASSSIPLGPNLLRTAKGARKREIASNSYVKEHVLVPGEYSKIFSQFLVTNLLNLRLF